MLVKKELLKAEIKTDLKADKSKETIVADILDIPKCGRVLVVDYYKKNRVERVFLDEKNFITYNEKNNMWNKSNPFIYCYGNKIEKQISEDKTNEIYEFLCRSYDHVYMSSVNVMIGVCIRENNQKIRQKQQEKKWARIRNAVSLLPDELPSYVKETLENKTLMHRGIIYKKDDRKRNKIKCCCCKKTSYVKDRPRHKQIIECPKCHSKIRISEERYAQSKSGADKKRLVYFCTAPTGEELLINATVVRKINEKHEYNYASVIDYFEVKTGSHINAYKFNYILYSYCDARFSSIARDVLITKNVDKFLGETICAKIDFKKLNGIEIDLEFLIRSVRENSITAKLINRGLYNLAEKAFLLPDSENFEKVFGLRKDYIKSIKRWNPTYHELQIIQIVDFWVGDEAYEKIKALCNRGCNQTIITSMTKTMTSKKAINYLYKQMILTKRGPSEIATLYTDYLELSTKLLKQLEKKPKIESRYLFPANIVTAHNRTSDQIRTINNLKKDKAINKLYTELHEAYEINAGGYIVLMPESMSDFFKEGRELHHCVGTSDKYIDMHISKKKMTFFIRKKENVENAYFTFTVDMKKMALTECYGANHEHATSNVKKVIEKFIDNIKNADKTKAA